MIHSLCNGHAYHRRYDTVLSLAVAHTAAGDYSLNDVVALISSWPTEELGKVFVHCLRAWSMKLDGLVSLEL